MKKFVIFQMDGGVEVWDTALVNESTLLVAIVEEYRRKFEEQNNSTK